MLRTIYAEKMAPGCFRIVEIHVIYLMESYAFDYKYFIVLLSKPYAQGFGTQVSL